MMMVVCRIVCRKWLKGKCSNITTTCLPISSLSAQCSAQAAQGGLRACSELLSELKAVRGEYQNRKGKPSMC